jgi:hypothetical protein
MRFAACRCLRRTSRLIPSVTLGPNAVSEGLNLRIQSVKATARGFRNQQNFINAIYFHCGGLDMAPAH